MAVDVRKNGGHAVAVHPRASRRRSARSCPRRALGDFRPADYRRGSDLFKRTCLLIDLLLADIRVQEEMWGWSRRGEDLPLLDVGMGRGNPRFRS